MNTTTHREREMLAYSIVSTAHQSGCIINIPSLCTYSSHNNRVVIYCTTAGTRMIIIKRRDPERRDGAFVQNYIRVLFVFSFFGGCTTQVYEVISAAANYSSSSSSRVLLVFYIVHQMMKQHNIYRTRSGGCVASSIIEDTAARSTLYSRQGSTAVPVSLLFFYYY